MPGPSNKAMYSYKNGHMFYGDGKGNITTGAEILEKEFFEEYPNSFKRIAESMDYRWTYELPLELLL